VTPKSPSNLGPINPVQTQALGTSRWVVFVRPLTNVTKLATAVKAKNEGPTKHIANTYVFKFSNVSDATVASRLRAQRSVTRYYELNPDSVPVREFVPNDPRYNEQWHLNNTGQSGGTAGEDMNAEPAWDDAKGSNVLISINDDGLEYTHPDLSPNYEASHSYDWVDDDNDPAPGAADDHGTAVGGLAAAKGDNGVGVTGVGLDARIAGLRMIGGGLTDQDLADIFGWHNQDVDIQNNSWGYTSNFGLEGALTLAALQNGVTAGRGGKGVIYVFSAGNDGDIGERTTYHTIKHLPYIYNVGTLDDNGVGVSYSEPGSNVIAVAYADGVTTTDRAGGNGYDGGDYTTTFNGTSAAAPQFSGYAALLLEANPNLSWRDIGHITARTAKKNDSSNPDWTTNGAGYNINHQYGFGALDAGAAVALAKTWTPVGAQQIFNSGTLNVGQAIPDGDANGITQTFNVTQDVLLERVQVQFNATHTSRGNLDIILTSPAGTKSVLAAQWDDDADDYNWSFDTVRHWDESTQGTWSLQVIDNVSGDTGNWTSWSITFGGYVPGSGGGGGGGGGPGTPGSEPNDRSDKASDLGSLSSQFTLDGLAIKNKPALDQDWYKFTVGGTGTLTIEMDVRTPTANLDMRLWTVNSRGTLIQLAKSTSTGNGTDEQIDFNVGLSTGRLYLQVYGYQGAQGDYSLTFTPPGSV
jgi:subtilisin-like proprotein convertase family protein